MNPPRYNSVLNNSEDESENERLPSYSSINLDEIEISLKIDKYKLKKNIKNINIFGYVIFVLNVIYFLFSILMDHIKIDNNNTIIYNNTNSNVYYNYFLYTLFVILTTSIILQSIIYYNISFNDLYIENKKKYNYNKIAFTIIYYTKYFLVFIFLSILAYDYYYIKYNNIYLVGVILVQYIINEFIDKMIILQKTNLLLLFY